MEYPLLDPGHCGNHKGDSGKGKECACWCGAEWDQGRGLQEEAAHPHLGDYPGCDRARAWDYLPEPPPLLGGLEGPRGSCLHAGWAVRRSVPLRLRTCVGWPGLGPEAMTFRPADFQGCMVPVGAVGG